MLVKLNDEIWVVDFNEPKISKEKNSNFFKRFFSNDQMVRYLLENKAESVQKMIKIEMRKNYDRFTHAFKAEFAIYPSDLDLMQAQQDKGYSPMGYGGPYKTKIIESNGFWIAEWTCSNNCD